IGALPTSSLTDALGLRVRAQVHVREIHPNQERFVGVLLPPNEINGAVRDVVIDRYHALLGQGASVRTDLFSDFSEARIDRGVVFVRRLAVQDAARPILPAELRVLRIVRQLWLFFGVQVVEVAIELIKAMHGRQELVTVAEVVLAKLSGSVSERLQQFRNR